MPRTIPIEEAGRKYNKWAYKSIQLFETTPYLDRIHCVYPFELSPRIELEPGLKREMVLAHNARDTSRLLDLLKPLKKFPYEDPVWFTLCTCNALAKNPEQIKRIAKNFYSMTAAEFLTRLEAAPELNTQTGPMFGAWTRKEFQPVDLERFEKSDNEIVILDVTEEVGKRYIQGLGQVIDKRPDLIAKAGKQIVIGEAKWIGQPGGNQAKQVVEVLDFCGKQRGDIRRVGIIDGFPWTRYNANNRVINNKEVVNVQESTHDLLSALLLREYLEQFLDG